MIYCPHCGTELNEGSRYCSHCGQQLKGNQQTPIHKSESRKKKWGPFLLPLSVFLIVSAALFFVYTHEQGVNEEVMNDKEEAEALAYGGQYKEAESILQKAVEKRPEVEALQADLASVRSVLSIKSDMETVETLIEEEKLIEAEEALSGVHQAIQERDSQLFSALISEADNLDSRITVMKINQELSQMTDIDELASKFNALSGLNLEEASKVREKITEKMVSISTQKAEEALGDKQYTQAIASVDQALQYAMNNEKLLQLKERIQQEKSAFEEQQQERLEKAMQQAAEDELRNQTDALEILQTNMEKDEFGDFKVTGKLKSVATQIISTITVTYDITNDAGEVLETDSAKVYPVYLNPGDEGTFEKVYYNLEGEGYQVNVTELEWLVE
ncbi:zinc ribbon domain-containing protein [Halobacillus litoralis]|uniref:zinc ribbon domain-containing protein n=1 Tax=Halobacillus litoralis TaxID=45668 RepID=UPI001CD7AD2C|nr:zinc ribbon domain-containing protein [Halobacillus litoralis]MCA0969525.1 zinc ribbon domain-containing protein [Halobacillus litoralis]